jgi:DNA-binding beta-propeller fold protein YncE
MNKKLLSILSVLVIFAFIGYMIYDAVHSENSKDEPAAATAQSEVIDMWLDTDELKINEGTLKAVAVSDSMIYLGGTSFVSGYKKDLKQVWTIPATASVTSVSCYNDTVYASTMDQILVISKDGKLIKEWGPYEKNSIITSVSAGKKFIAFADAGNRTVFILDKGGEVRKMIGGEDNQFVIPSAYFDVAMNADEIYVANTGHRRIETRSSDGTMISYFGEAGTSPNTFCGCCNPAHFAVIPSGFVTAEKGINRIKILNNKGEFVEFVSSVNDFTPAMPLDVASSDGKTIYAANNANSTLYVFKRK